MGKRNMLRYCIAALLLAAAALTTTSCAKNRAKVKIDPYYITGGRENRESLQDLFGLLAQENSSAEDQFVVIREIANNFARLKEYGRLIHFLGGWTINYPGDPYNSYYLLMIAYAYMQQGSYPVAARYFEIIIKNYGDLTVNGESIHLACLKQLIELSDNPEQQVWYYQELISRFSEKIDLGAAWFMLAQAYERVGDWNGAIGAYTRYQPYAGALIPGFPNADNHAKQQVDFHNSPKDWTFESLPALLGAVQAALDTGNPWQLRRCQAKVNFFARSWEQGETDDSGMADFNLSDFMRGNRIQYAGRLDASSNATEAFLRTWGWSQYISIWYLYFRKIYFPSDPEIHGRWEWAGVYYGEKF
ncbi:MAG: tetratricopeptide repeat protein [Treponema sp.]|jgi:tetratricopeptide (TPR) repeat protein|nr:tetratricopeptide repeat protein [Treponema sp.]